jgi:hypothetical protein
MSHLKVVSLPQACKQIEKQGYNLVKLATTGLILKLLARLLN